MYTSDFSKELKSVMSKGRKTKFLKKQIIQSTDDRRVFNYIISGYVKRYLITNEGSLAVEVIYGPGDAFPITLAFSALFNQTINESPEIFYYETVTDVEAYTITETELKQIVYNNPGLYKDLMGVAGKRLHSTLQGLENIALKDAYSRLAHELYFLAVRFGQETADGTRILIPLTHQDLAGILSVTRETISTNMVRLKKENLVKTDKGIVIKDMQKLKAKAYD